MGSCVSVFMSSNTITIACQIKHKTYVRTGIVGRNSKHLWDGKGEAYLIDKLMMEVRYFKVMDASHRFFHVTRGQILLQQHHHLKQQVDVIKLSTQDVPWGEGMLARTFLMRYLTGLMPPPTPHTLSSLTIPCFMFSSVSA